MSALHIDLNKNMHYDRLTRKIMKNYLKPDSNCIDIGCFKGEILDEILKLAPEGIHFAFEPIPAFYNELRSRYKSKVEIFPFAISDSRAITTYNFVRNAPAYSGLKIRSYKVENPDIQVIEVETRPLDDIIPETLAIHFIKLDVEGGEYHVFLGAKNLIKKDKPLIVFESGMGSIKNYNVKPEDIFDYLHGEFDYKISLLKNFNNKKSPLSRENFLEVYLNETEYYFVAHS